MPDTTPRRDSHEQRAGSRARNSFSQDRPLRHMLYGKLRHFCFLLHEQMRLLASSRPAERVDGIPSFTQSSMSVIQPERQIDRVNPEVSNGLLQSDPWLTIPCDLDNVSPGLYRMSIRNSEQTPGQFFGTAGSGIVSTCIRRDECN